MGKIYINCSRCGKDLECEELCDVYTSKIDDSFICKDCYKEEKPDYIQQLKQQLEDKNELIENLTKRINKYENMFRSRGMKKTGDMQKDIELYMNQLAINELEKVKILLQNAANYEGHTFVGIYDAVNNQIRELKGE